MEASPEGYTGEIDSVTPETPEITVRLPSTDDLSPTWPRFQASVRLWKGAAVIAQCLEPALAPLEWWVTRADGQPEVDWLHVEPGPGYGATVSLTGDPPDPVPDVYVRVRSGDRATEPGLLVTFIVEDATQEGDLVVALHADGAAPAAAMVEGRLSDGENLEFKPFAFVGQARLGNLIDTTSSGTSALAVLSTDHGMVLNTSPGWTSHSDRLDVQSSQEDLLRVPVTLMVGIGAEPDKWSDWAQSDLLLANALLKANRVGISLVSVYDPPVMTEAVGSCRCITTSSLPAWDDGIPYPDILKVYYVGKVAEGEGAYGVTCPDSLQVAKAYSQAHGPVVLVGKNALATTLAHEIGHVLGLDHVYGPEFSSMNLMHPAPSDLAGRGRSQFSLGQVVRMNADAVSWLFFARETLGDPPAVESGSQYVRARQAVWLSCQANSNLTTATSCPTLVSDFEKRQQP